MKPDDAKRLVLEREERMPINLQWLSTRIGKPAQSITQWLSGDCQPRDPQIWVVIADTLALTHQIDPRIAIVREAMLYIIENSSEADVRAKAVAVLRQYEDVQR
jgi:hypothetical protein